MDQVADADDEEVDIEYDEETGSEDTSNTDEEVEGQDDLDIGVDGTEEVWTEDEDDIEEDEEGTDDDESDDDAEEEGSLGDGEMMWQVCPGRSSDTCISLTVFH